jgi:DNA-binding NtrC family response regulator
MILLIEDDILARRTLSGILRNKGFRVFETGNASNALVLLEECPFEVVIADLFLPDTRGFEIVDVIRNTCPTTPLIVISGYISQLAGEDILGKTVTFLQKPINTDALVETVERLRSRA